MATALTLPDGQNSATNAMIFACQRLFVFTIACGWLCGQPADVWAESPEAASPAPVISIPLGPRVQFLLQRRLIEAEPGSVIQLEAGRYEFSGELNLVCRHVTLRGRGSDQTILSFKDQHTGDEGLIATGDGFVLEDLAVEDTAGNGVKVLGARDVTIQRVRVEWTDGPRQSNGAYGIYPVQCERVRIEDCTVRGASDAGVYVGQSKKIVVRRCRVESNVVGIELENTNDADVSENTAINNAGGILVINLPGLPVMGGERTRVFRNRIERNNLSNFAPPGNIVAEVPSGAGLMLMAVDQVEVFDNDINDNDTANVLVVSYLITQRPPTDGEYDPYPEGIAIHDNRLAGGGKRPGGTLGKVVAPLVGNRFADVVTDGLVNSKRLQNVRLPDAFSLRLSDNGPISFLDFGLNRLNSADILHGRYRINRDAAAFNGRLPPLPVVEIVEPARIPAERNLAVAVYRRAPQRLSDWKLFAGSGSSLEPAAGVWPYELNTALFSDYAQKKRFFRLPPATAISYRAEGALEFPVGTVIAKSFYSPAEPAAKPRLIETRLELREESGWYGYSYVWDESQQEAYLALGGDERLLEWHDAHGAVQTNRYEIPNANQCLTCHNRKNVFEPLGPTAENLNLETLTAEGVTNQLEHWRTLGLLKDAPAREKIPRLARADDPASGSVADRARAWLHVNCAHCHRPEGTARTSGLDLRVTQTDPLRLGIGKSPVASGRGSGRRRFDIVPGEPEASILLFRLESTEPGVRMPSLSRNLVHQESVALIRDWIQAMPPDK